MDGQVTAFFEERIVARGARERSPKRVTARLGQGEAGVAIPQG
jgi:hypothetical protein